MKLITGLGNPSPEYGSTRHNAGFMAVDRISSVSGIKLDGKKHRSVCGRGLYLDEDVILAKPLTFVNLSGIAVRSFLKYYPLEIEDILIIHDDMDIPLGGIRIKSGGGSAGHRGVESVARELGTGAFARLRIGIAPPESSARGVKFVLGRFSAGEKAVLEDVLSDCVRAVEEIIPRGVQSGMNKFN